MNFRTLSELDKILKDKQTRIKVKVNWGKKHNDLISRKIIA